MDSLDRSAGELRSVLKALAAEFPDAVLNRPKEGSHDAEKEYIAVRLGRKRSSLDDYGATKVLRPPRGASARVRSPVQPLRSCRGLEPVERYRNVFDVGLLSVEVPSPPPRGEWTFSVEVSHR